MMKSTFLVLLLLFSSLIQADNVINLAESLAKIRGEVEELQTQLDLAKDAHQTRMDVLSSQYTDLSVESRRQKVSFEKLEQSLLTYQENVAQSQSTGALLKPTLLEVLGVYRLHVEAGLPFKRADRLSAIEELENKINNDLLEPKKATNRLWAFIEDEIRLSKENGIYRQTIELNGEKILAEIAKLGSVMMFFQTNDNQVGMAQQGQDGGWRFVELDSSQDREQIGILFDSLKKQIRQGYFELPNPLKS